MDAVGIEKVQSNGRANSGGIRNCYDSHVTGEEL
jgi:hypothetical protein